MSSFDKCVVCGKTAYDNEMIMYDKKRFHKTCFKCLNCKSTVSLGAVAMIQGDLYCKNCFVRMFQERGSYGVFKPGAERVKAPTKEEKEGPKEKQECTLFEPQAWKPTKCKTCQKEKTEHSEAALQPTTKTEDKSAGSTATGAKKKPCKFGFRAHPDAWRKNICKMCGLTEAEHSGGGGGGATEGAEAENIPSDLVIEDSGSGTSTPADVGSPTVPVVTPPTEETPFERVQRLRREAAQLPTSAPVASPESSNPESESSNPESESSAPVTPQVEETPFERVQRLRREAALLATSAPSESSSSTSSPSSPTAAASSTSSPSKPKAHCAVAGCEHSRLPGKHYCAEHHNLVLTTGSATPLTPTSAPSPSEPKLTLISIFTKYGLELLPEIEEELRQWKLHGE